MSQTATATATYTTTDIEKVVRRVTTDLVMIADSSAAITADKAREYGHDIELLAKNGYLKKVDVTLLSAGVEQRAVCYEVNTASGNLESSRPGGVLWPKVASPFLRLVLSYTSAYDDTARAKMAGKLKIGWSPTSADTSHSGLSASGGRDYASNSYGMQRKDWAA
ncbi:HORMA-1 domain-containing protein [Sphingomonas adhaesiva]|uniref:HORMA-1 domain-containing protein n=1 Tax=Sphingomonas adhaesiva TaxID=28212 RepID=UPI002FF6940E